MTQDTLYRRLGGLLGLVWKVALSSISINKAWGPGCVTGHRLKEGVSTLVH